VKQLFLLNARELFRDRRFFVFAFVFPYLMLGTFIAIGKILGASSEGFPDMAVMSLPMAIFLAVTGSGLTVTAGPLADLRGKGVLRLLGTTPVKRWQFIATHLAARVIMLTVQIAGLIAVAWAAGTVQPESILPLFGASILALMLFLAAGYVVGSLTSTATVGSAVGTIVQMLAFLTCGLVLPFALLPDALANVLSRLPTTYAADLTVAAIPQLTAVHPPTTSVLVTLATTAVVFVLAVAVFRWDSTSD
jgi:ABC-2 type transport system permease protein